MALLSTGSYQVNWGLASFAADSGSGSLFDAIDLDNNGYTDFLFADAVYPPNDLRETTGDIILQSAEGFTLLKNAFAGTIHPREFVFSDFNSDGVLDFFIAAHGYDASPFDGESNVLMISQNNSYVSQQTELFLPNGFTHSGAAGDIDNDNDSDFISVNLNPQVLLFTNDGDGNFTNSSELLPETLSRPGSIFKATSSLLHDIDGDGYVDILLGSDHSRGTHLTIYFGSSSGRYTDSNKLILQDSPVEFGNQIVLDILAMDIDLDGDEDLITSFTKMDSFYAGAGHQVYENLGNREFENISSKSLGSAHFDDAYSWVQFLKVVDFNQDGIDDIFLQPTFWQDANMDQPIVLLGGGDSTFSSLAKGDLVDLEREYILHYVLPSFQNGQFSLQGGQYYQGKLLVHEISIESNPVVELDAKMYRYMELGTSRDDSLEGDDRDNLLIGGLGNDDLRGGLGVDTALFSGGRQHYVITRTATNMFVQDQRDFGYGVDTLDAVERLEFDDLNLAIDIDGSAGLTAKTLAAVIGEEGLSNKEYVGIGLQLFDAGQSLASVCELALAAVGATTNEAVVNLLYTNLYGEAPTAEVAQPFIDALTNGEYSKGVIASAAAELTDDLGVIDLVGLAETGIEYV